jgi:O-antigen ligase
MTDNKYIKYLSVDSLTRYLNYSVLILFFVLPFSIALANVFSGIILFIYIILIFRDPSILKENFIFKFPLLLFIIFRIISIIFSINVGSSLITLYKDLPFYLLIFAFFHGLKNNFSFNILIISRIILYTAILSSLIGMGSFFLGISGRAVTTSYGYTSLGIFLTASLAYLIFLKDNRNVFQKNYYWYVSMIIIIAGILLTFNRTHWVAIILLLLFYSVYTKRYIPLAAMALLFVVGFIFFPEFRVRLEYLLYFWSHMSDRDTLWKGAYKIIFDRPFLGFGPNTFADVFMYQDLMGDKLVGSWHNDYLQTYMESGIFTLCIFIYMVMLIPFNLIKYFKKVLIEDKNYFLSVSLPLMFFIIFGGYLEPLGGLLFKLFLSIFAVFITYLLNKYNI